MKKTISVFMVIGMILFSSFAWAQSETKPEEYTWEVGPEISSIEYKEPGVMKEKGVMYGINASYTYHRDLMFKVEARYSYGQVDYENSGTINNIDNSIFEMRLLAGYDFSTTGSSVITPYIGFGYRWLYDDMGGRISSTGASGYDRESQYYYSPIGIETYTEIGNSWSWGMTAEFDYFWGGKQKSYLSDVDSTLYSDAENTQNNGYGLRGSVRFQKKGENIDYKIEPFVRYWNIDKSELDYVTYNGTPNTAVYEPDNESTEIGIIFMIIF